MFSSTSSRRAFSWLLQYSSYTQNLSFCKTRTEPVGDSSQQGGRCPETCWASGPAEPGTKGRPQTLRHTRQVGFQLKGLPLTSHLHSRPSSAPSDLPGSSMAQGQGYRLKPGRLDLNPGSAFPAVNWGKPAELSVPWFPHLLRWN